MKHAGPQALAKITPLLDRVRERPSLVERRPGVFYRSGRALLHFHEDPAGLFADLRFPDDWHRFPVDGAAGRAALIDALDSLLK